MEIIIGSHVSFNSKTQLLGTAEEAISYGANTFMFYTGSTQSTLRGEIDDKISYEALKLMNENNINIKNVIVHSPYIVNFANRADERKYEFYIDFFSKELDRCKKLGITKIVLHPGSAVNCTREEGINNIIFALNKVIENTEEVIILLEYMPGKGNELGRSIDELKLMIDGVKEKSRVAVCLDSCHMNDSGIDITNIDSFLDEFDSKIGIDKIKCFHINDSLNEVGSRKDRHANIGYGNIGFDNIINIVYNKRLQGIPFILETPYVNRNQKDAYAPYKYEIENIRNKKFIDFIQ
ncbi:MAG: deoxyribonuclease IV [Tenericutes bacterium]|nr:deoxyribonuclease IV [Mycoplasmatota bacterium]